VNNRFETDGAPFSKLSAREARWWIEERDQFNEFAASQKGEHDTRQKTTSLSFPASIRRFFEATLTILNTMILGAQSCESMPHVCFSLAFYLNGFVVYEVTKPSASRGQMGRVPRAGCRM
jgi:hypothetical protein